MFTHAEFHLVGQFSDLTFSGMALMQMTHGYRQQGLVYFGEVNWDMVCKGSQGDLMEHEACVCLPIPKENVTGQPPEIMVFNREWNYDQTAELWTTKNVGRPQLFYA